MKFQGVLDIDLLSTFIDGVYSYFGGIFGVVINLINILVALFTGDNSKLKDNVNTLITENLPKILEVLEKYSSQ